MRIAIVGYFNPRYISDYLYNDDIPSVNITANSVNTYVMSLLNAGHFVRVFTTFGFKGKDYLFKGRNVEVFMTSSYGFMKGIGFFSRLYMPRKLIKLMENHLEDIDVLHAQWTYDFALAAKYFSYQKPVFCTIRDWCPYILSTQKSLVDKIYWYISLVLFRNVMNSDKIHFIANSSYTYQCALSEYPKKYIYIIPNPINSKFYVTNRICQPHRNTFVSIAHSLEDPRKNVTKLLKAFKLYRSHLPSAQLLLIGNYSLNSEIYCKWKTDNLLINVTFTGSLKQDDVIRTLDKCYCLVHPSLEETFGNILLEAMSRRVPCIGGKNAGAVPYVLKEGECGILCDVEDPEDIYRAMLEIDNESKVKEIVDNATKMIKNEYLSEIIAKKHIEIYKDALDKKNQ